MFNTEQSKDGTAGRHFVTDCFMAPDTRRLTWGREPAGAMPQARDMSWIWRDTQPFLAGNRIEVTLYGLSGIPNVMAGVLSMER